MGIHRLNFIFSCSIIRPQRTRGIQEEEEEEEEEAGEMDEILGCQQLLKISVLRSVSNDDRRDRETQRGGEERASGC